MATEMGEYIVGAYLKLILGCDVLDYNSTASVRARYLKHVLGASKPILAHGPSSSVAKPRHLGTSTPSEDYRFESACGGKT